MNLFKLVADLERVAPDLNGRLDTRRRVFGQLGTTGRTIASAFLPGLLSGLFQKAYGQTGSSGDAITGLMLALNLEYLEYYFYATATGDSSKNIAPSPFFTKLSTADQTALLAIRDDEQGHITTLRGLLSAAAIADPTAAAFDYSAGNKLTPFSDLASFLAVAQSFEDLGIRAYKSIMPTLLSSKDALTTIFNIHSVEARHASHIRTLRRGGVGVAGADGGGPNDSLPKSWVSLQESGGPVPSLTSGIYAAGTTTASPAEDNIIQAKLNVQTNASLPSPMKTTLNPNGISVAASEAFDEPLDAAQVKVIALNFVAAGNPKGLFM